MRPRKTKGAGFKLSSSTHGIEVLRAFGQNQHLPILHARIADFG